jgi:hypothetical protein
LAERTRLAGLRDLEPAARLGGNWPRVDQHECKLCNWRCLRCVCADHTGHAKVVTDVRETLVE